MLSIQVETIRSEFSVSDIIQIVSIMTSLLVSIVSTVIAVVAVRQTSKAAKQSAEDKLEVTRGNIGISFDLIQHSSLNPVGYFVIKK